MIPLPPITLPTNARTKLRGYQATIDGKTSYALRVAEAKRRFSQHNKTTNTTFQAVKLALTATCSGVRRCHYCEDSCADEVEHFRPKDLYPEATFVWENYLYACGPCNGRKSNHFAILILAQGQPATQEVVRPSGAAVVAPPDGQPALIDPRVENPLALIGLDLLDTFRFVALPNPDTADYAVRYAAEPYAHDLPGTLQARATYTITTLTLNRDILPAARREAYEAYKDRLDLYIVRRDRGDSQDALDRRIKALRRMPHPTVWHEMKRQQQAIPELAALFAQAPEALTW
jgi:hypothetical protein